MSKFSFISGIISTWDEITDSLKLQLPVTYHAEMQAVTRPVGSGAAWRRSPHQKSAGGERERETEEKGKKKEREEKEKREEKKKRKREGEQEGLCCGCKHLLRSVTKL